MYMTDHPAPPNRTYSVAEARNQLPALLHDVEAGAEISLSRRGRRVAVLMSAARFAELSAAKPDLWTALESFWARHTEEDLQALDIEGALRGIRDPSPGREPVL